MGRRHAKKSRKWQSNSWSRKIYPERYRKLDMQDCNPSRTPAENKLKLVKATERETLVDERLYRSLVRSLLYIAWIVNVHSRFMDKPISSHCLPGKRVLRYLQATKLLKLVYPRDNDFHLHGESDADWSGDHDDRRSTTGYFSSLVSVGVQLAGKRRSSRLWLSYPAMLSIRVWQQLCKRQPSCTVVAKHSADAGNMDWWRLPNLHQIGEQASLCTTDQSILTESITLWRRHQKSLTKDQCFLSNTAFYNCQKSWVVPLKVLKPANGGLLGGTIEVQQRLSWKECDVTSTNACFSSIKRSRWTKLKPTNRRIEVEKFFSLLQQSVCWGNFTKTLNKFQELKTLFYITNNSNFRRNKRTRCTPENLFW